MNDKMTNERENIAIFSHRMHIKPKPCLRNAEGWRVTTIQLQGGVPVIDIVQERCTTRQKLPIDNLRKENFNGLFNSLREIKRQRVQDKDFEKETAKNLGKIDMGSEGAASVRINVTGFKKFRGVNENPTEIIVNKLKSYVENRGLMPDNITLGICNVLETAGDGAVSDLYKVLDSGLSSSRNDTRDEKVVWLHLGVNSGLQRFTIERQAVNEATFCCPDELGWQPQQLPIVLGDGGISRIRETSCCVEEIARLLKLKDHDVAISNDAGRFVCNFVYYHSLVFAEQRGHKSLFVHIPPFSRINEETQMEIVTALIEAVASTC